MVGTSEVYKSFSSSPLKIPSFKAAEGKLDQVTSLSFKTNSKDDDASTSSKLTTPVLECSIN